MPAREGVGGGSAARWAGQAARALPHQKGAEGRGPPPAAPGACLALPGCPGRALALDRSYSMAAISSLVRSRMSPLARRALTMLSSPSKVPVKSPQIFSVAST